MRKNEVQGWVVRYQNFEEQRKAVLHQMTGHVMPKKRIFGVHGIMQMTDIGRQFDLRISDFVLQKNSPIIHLWFIRCQFFLLISPISDFVVLWSLNLKLLQSDFRLRSTAHSLSKVNCWVLPSRPFIRHRLLQSKHSYFHNVVLAATLGYAQSETAFMQIHVRITTKSEMGQINKKNWRPVESKTCWWLNPSEVQSQKYLIFKSIKRIGTQ